MSKETITTSQAISILMMFIFGSTIMTGAGSGLGQDSWVALLLSFVIVAPALFVYARIMKLYPEQDIYDIFLSLFGKIGGRIFILIITWYALHLGALVLRNFSEFIVIISMPETPQLPVMIIMLFVGVYMIKSGIVTMGKWSLLVLPLVLLTVILTIILSVNKMEFDRLLPVMEHSFNKVFIGAYQTYTFPLAETILFLCIGRALKGTANPYKIYYLSVIISLFFMLLVVLRNIVLLGPSMMDAQYYPSYIAARLIDIGDFLSRIEGTISMNFVLGGIMRLSLCLLAASIGTAKLFDIQNYKQIVLPVSLLVLALGSIIFKSNMEMFAALTIYQYYAIPFQIFIPLIVWITAEVKNHIQKNKNAEAAAS